MPNITVEEIKALQALMTIRNSELHGHEDALLPTAQKEVMPVFFSFAAKVSDFTNFDLEQILGHEGAVQARKTADARLKNRKERVKSLIKIQKDRFFGLLEEEQEKRRKDSEIGFLTAVMSSGHRVKSYKCPSCSQQGYLAGSPVGSSGPILNEDGIFQENRVVPEIFECKCCELKITGLDELMAAGIEHEFTSLDEIDIVEHFDINPMDYVDPEEIVREYSGYEEYMDE